MSHGQPTCHPERKLFARGLCQSCYLRLRKEEREVEAPLKAAGLRLCRGCGQWKTPDQFYRRASRCKPCRVAEVAQYERTHAGPDLKESHRRASREWHRRNPEYVRNAHLNRQYGISSVEFQELLAKQNGVCAICGGTQADPARPLAVDHDHDTGRVRGLLCDPCNQGLGGLQDSPELLKRAIEYLS